MQLPSPSRSSVWLFGPRYSDIHADPFAPWAVARKGPSPDSPTAYGAFAAPELSLYVLGRILPQTVQAPPPVKVFSRSLAAQLSSWNPVTQHDDVDSFSGQFSAFSLALQQARQKAYEATGIAPELPWQFDLVALLWSQYGLHLYSSGDLPLWMVCQQSLIQLLPAAPTTPVSALPGSAQGGGGGTPACNGRQYFVPRHTNATYVMGSEGFDDLAGGSYMANIIERSQSPHDAATALANRAHRRSRAEDHIVMVVETVNSSRF
jgi:hypothetical protein